MKLEWPQRVRKLRPLVHCITNYVTVNDVANLLLACGASPVMADSEEEAADMAAIANALLINLGTLNAATVRSMHLAAASAHECGIPIVLDPVGVGATRYRSSTAEALLREHQFALIRGNISEIKALAAIVQPDQGADSVKVDNAGSTGNTKGVDAGANDLQDAVQGRVILARELSRRTGTVVVISGAEDVIAGADGPAFVCSNGCAAMQDITGSGCMLSALLAAYAAAAWQAEGNRQQNLLHAAAAGVAAMGICGERAEKLTQQHRGGNASLRTHLIDSVYRLDRLDNAVKLSADGKQAGEA